MSTLRIGWAEENITPEQKISLAGQFAERISQYVEKPLTVTAMAIEKDGEQAVIVSTDLAAVAWNLVEAVRERLADNKDGLFVSYQWYADSIAISGATEQFYRLTDTLTPHLYYVEATMTNGRVRTSCVQLFEQFAPSATQHPAQSARLILRDGQLYIKTEDALYDIFGRRSTSTLVP